MHRRWVEKERKRRGERAKSKSWGHFTRERAHARASNYEVHWKGQNKMCARWKYIFRLCTGAGDTYDSSFPFYFSRRSQLLTFSFHFSTLFFSFLPPFFSSLAPRNNDWLAFFGKFGGIIGARTWRCTNSLYLFAHEISKLIVSNVVTRKEIWAKVSILPSRNYSLVYIVYRMDGVRNASRWSIK